jgi:hypothetical protein
MLGSVKSSVKNSPCKKSVEKANVNVK